MKNFFRYFFAIFLIAIGVMLIMANIGVGDFNFNVSWQYIYPIFFIAIGLKWFIDFLRKRGGSWVFGSFFLIFGSLLLMDSFKWIVFGFWDVFKLWPLLIVYIGFSLLGRKHFTIHYDADTNTHKSFFDGFTFTVGDHHFNDENWKVEPMNLRHLAGDFYFDFSKAFIPEKRIPISVSSLAGDINILMPENVDFRVHASVNAGDIKILGQSADGLNRTLNFQTSNYDAATKKIDFHISLKAGSVRIDQV
ncbi:cell wall-active antibiotics response protein LiaF [Oceanobacillus saliphilus]|uniref:cell wall-active antibiotics response protein LiaF n=1 Tax=Oceanobacillus saliphilus TaxID=2925834 RepID=UPI00201D458C|nr:cell wall-active antibiotics response protein LiaF [Oceanobacillus saliphilus]